MNTKFILQDDDELVELSFEDILCDEKEMQNRRKFVEDNPTKSLQDYFKKIVT